MKKRNFAILLKLFLFALILGACSDDNSTSSPKLSFSAATAEVAENATSALVVKINADQTIEKDYTVNIELAGTAVEGTNFQTISKTVKMRAGKTEANIFINPINISTIETDKIISISLKSGNSYTLGEVSKIDITIKDNQAPVSDAPEFSFVTGNFTTNPYMEEEKTFTVALSAPMDEEINIPLNFEGELVKGTDYELEGINDDNTITIPAQTVSVDFKMKMKYSNQIGMNKNMNVTFATPKVVDYVVKEGSQVLVNAIDPVVDMGAWFNDTNEYNFFFAAIQNTTTPTFNTDLSAYDVKRYYWDSETTDETKWKTLSGDHYFVKNTTDKNQWKEVINIYQKKKGFRNLNYDEQEHYEVQSGDFLGLTKMLSNEAKYGKSLMQTEQGWFRFVATEEGATSGKVVVPAQTIKVYKTNGAALWTEKLYAVDKDTDPKSYYYGWFADANANKGDMSKSSNVEVANIEIKRSVGSYDITKKEIIVEIDFSYDDADIVFADKYIISKDGNNYKMKIKYINVR
ncbi:MAG: hypothetical protein N4A49_13965 [Marinifilaceae bacterium]|jgi:hypothetical protein|nr:hypothetical protein [Marinifilaceae bacterium]